jgi:hypothetical protein
MHNHGTIRNHSIIHCMETIREIEEAIEEESMEEEDVEEVED